MNRQFIYRESNQGSILVVCLWVVMILAILGLGVTGLVFQEIKFSKAYSRIVTSLPAAQGALKAVFYLRDKEATPAYDTWDELSKEEQVSLCGNSSYRYFFVDKNNSVASEGIIDESALINLNLASVDVLARLPGMNKELAEALVNSGLRPFSSINEVLLVKDISKDNFQLFKNLVTVYGTGKININTASRAVLLALGLDEDTVKAIIRFRQEHKIESLDPEAPKELGYGFSDINKVLDDLRSFTSLGLRQEQDILSLLPVLSVKSEHLRFNIIPSCAGIQGLHYSVVICPATKKILSWNEY